MKRIAITIAAAFAMIGLTATPAFADSPHFLYADNSIGSNTGALTTSFKDAGLGTGTTSIKITAGATSIRPRRRSAFLPSLKRCRAIAVPSAAADVSVVVLTAGSPFLQAPG